MICNSNDFVLWLKNSQLSDRTINEYNRYLGKLNLFAELNQEVLNEFVFSNNNTVAKAFLKNLLEFLKRKDLDIPKSRGRKKTRIPNILNPTEIEVLAQNFQDPRNELMLRLQYEGALRVGELFSIRLNKIIWEDWIKDQNKNGKIIVLGKGNKERIALISSSTMTKLYYWIESKKFPENFGDQCIWEMSLRRWQKILEEVSLKVIGRKVNTHLLRHSRASHILDKDVDIRYIQDLLGHSSLQSTQIYTHFNKKKLIDLMAEKGF